MSFKMRTTILRHQTRDRPFANANEDDRSLWSYQITSSPETHDRRWDHLYVLPVLLLEFLAIALTRAVLPALLLKKFGNSVYLVMGVTDCVRGLLAFISCPLFGKISDIVGRKGCLFVTVLGTCAPVCSLALFSWRNGSDNEVVVDDLLMSSTVGYEEENMLDTSDSESTMMMPMSTLESATLSEAAITTFVILLALSGAFQSTFTLVFAYISDTVQQQEERVAAYGLALATFGLSFTIGPMAGGYIAQTNTHYVFVFSFILTVLDLLYVYFILPESRHLANDHATNLQSTVSIISDRHTYSPANTLRLIITDPFLRKVGQVAFLYYTGLWAIISTISVYAVKRFHMGPERLGELMSALGLGTMIAEAVLVRIMVPMLGEKQAMKVGLVAFGLQCVVLGFAYQGWQLFLCAACSLLANLVYPSLSSLVSGNVEPDSVGEALGAVNGVKALTEGIGPLLFGSLMTVSENSRLPGWPYLLAAVLVYGAYLAADDLPDPEDDDYIHELEKKHQSRSTAIMMQRFLTDSASKKNRIYGVGNEGVDEDAEALLSEIESEEEDDGVQNILSDGSESMSQLPVTFASLLSAK